MKKAKALATAKAKEQLEINRKLFEEAKKQEENNRRLFEEGISLKPVFKDLAYPDKLKFMDKYFGGASAAGEDRNTEDEDKKSHFPPIINAWPKEGDHCQIKLYNEWKIKLFESLEPALSVEFSFERLKKRFEDHISDVKKEKHPELSITKYTQEQISLYKEKVQSSDVQLQWKEFGGAWDTSKKVIPNFIPFLKARAYYNYIGFLENEPEIDSKYTVKSVLMAYYYMHRKKIYLISELQGPWVLKNIHEKLHQMYGFSTNSFKNDWNPIFKNGEKNPKNIRLAVKLLRTFDDPRIKESIELANSELKEAELKP